MPTCIMYILHIHVLCTSYVYMYYVHLMSTCIMYIFAQKLLHMSAVISQFLVRLCALQRCKHL